MSEVTTKNMESCCRTVIIKKRVTLESRYLDEDIESHLLTKVSNIVKGKCTQEYGRILEVKRLVDTGKNWIAAGDSRAIFVLEFEAEIFKPEKGLVSGNVIQVYADGIFTKVLGGHQMVMIPSHSIKSYRYVEEDNMYVNKDGHQIKLGDEVEVFITAIQFKNQKRGFDCIGSLKES